MTKEKIRTSNYHTHVKGRKMSDEFRKTIKDSWINRRALKEVS